MRNGRRCAMRCAETVPAGPAAPVVRKKAKNRKKSEPSPQSLMQGRLGAVPDFLAPSFFERVTDGESRSPSARGPCAQSPGFGVRRTAVLIMAAEFVGQTFGSAGFGDFPLARTRSQG